MAQIRRTNAMLPCTGIGYRVMRASPLVLVLLAGLACNRGALQPPGGGGGAGMLSLDAAGTGDGAVGDGGPGASDVAIPTPDANCGLMTLSFTYRVPEILILLDQSVTGNGSDWSALLRALTSVMVDNGIRIDWGLYTFPEGVSACGAGTLTDVIDMPVTPMDYASVAGGVGA
jgi:hypothetical protein